MSSTYMEFQQLFQPAFTARFAAALRLCRGPGKGSLPATNTVSSQPNIALQDADFRDIGGSKEIVIAQTSMNRAFVHCYPIESRTRQHHDRVGQRPAQQLPCNNLGVLCFHHMTTSYCFYYVGVHDPHRRTRAEGTTSVRAMHIKHHASLDIHTIPRGGEHSIACTQITTPLHEDRSTADPTDLGAHSFKASHFPVR